MLRIKSKAYVRTHLPLLAFILAFTTIGSYFLIHSFAASNPNVYIAQSAAGAGNGSDCADAEPVSFFNTSTNWGTGSTQIGPGTTVHLCGTISTTLTAQGSGASGNPITVLWEPGASLSQPVCPNTGCFRTNGNSNLTLDGGTNGIIESTANGTNLANHASSTGIYAPSCAGCTFKNLTIQNLYVHVAGSTSVSTELGGSDQTSINAIKWSGSNTGVINNTIHDAGWALWYDGSSGDSNIEISGNDIYNMDHGIAIAPAAGTYGNLVISSNHIHDMANWDCGGGCHHDPVHCFGGQNGNTYNGFYIYDNLFDGTWSNATSSATFIEGNFGSPGDTPCTPSALWVFNNIAMPTDEDGCCGILGGSQGAGGFFNNTTRGATNTVAWGPCMGAGGYSVNGTVLFENNVMDNCNTLFSGIAYGAGTKGTTAQGDPDYDAYINGGSNSFSGTGPPSNSCASMPFTAFTSWKSCMGGVEAHGGQFSTDAAAGINSNGSLASGSSLIGAANNLTSTCNTFPTSPVNVQAACQTGYTGPPAGGGAGSTTAAVARPSTGSWDIGAYQSSSTPQPVVGDLNADGHVNIFDLSIFLSHWQQSGAGLSEDFNSDGIVNIFDLSILLSHYGT